MSNADRPIPATLIPGDGIGPEITEAVVAILDALGSPFEWDQQTGGTAGMHSGGDPLPATLLDSISRARSEHCNKIMCEHAISADRLRPWILLAP
jgi:isocitrate/isopropylmalate dehydrogenase